MTAYFMAEGEGQMEGRAEWGKVVRLVENCFIRATPSAAGAVLGVEKRGGALPYGGRVSPEGWLSTVYRGVPGWVSGRFARRE